MKWRIGLSKTRGVYQPRPPCELLAANRFAPKRETLYWLLFMASARKDGARPKRNKHSCSRTPPVRECWPNPLRTFVAPLRNSHRLEVTSLTRRLAASPGSSFGPEQNMPG